MKNIWEENIPEEQMLSWVMDMMGPRSADSIQTRCERVSQPHPAPGKAWLPLGREVGGGGGGGGGSVQWLRISKYSTNKASGRTFVVSDSDLGFVR